MENIGFAPAAALALFVPGLHRGRSLVIGDSGSSLVDAITFFGGTAVACGLQATARLPGLPVNSRSERVRDHTFLPFENASFDSIVLDRALERCGTAPAVPSPKSQRALLRECDRVLKKGGSLLLAVENRFGKDRIRQQRPDPVTAGRYLGMLPHRLADIYSRARYSQPYDYRSHSLRGWQSVLRQEGFVVEDLRSLWSPDEGAKEVTFGESLSHRLTWRNLPRTPGILGAAASFIRQPAIKRHFAPAFLLIARRARDANTIPLPPSILSAIGHEEVIGPGIPPLPLTIRKTSQTVSFVNGSTFLKIPLTFGARERLLREAAAHDRLKGRPVSSLMLESVALKDIGVVQYVTYPAMELRNAPRSAAELRMHYDALLSALGADARKTRLRDTEFWNLVFSPGMPDELLGLGAKTVLDRLRVSGNRRVPAGVVHGDMARNNLMVTSEGMRVIDWDRWEEPSPHFIDVVAASFSVGRAEGMWDPHDRVSQITRMCAGDSRVPFLDRLLWASGDLSLAEAIAFRMLSRAVRQRLYHPNDRSFDNGLRAYFEAFEIVLCHDAASDDVNR